MWFHVILYGLAMAVIFALTLCLVSYIDPQSFTKMYPPAIQKIAPQIPPESRKTEITMLVCLWTFMMFLSITSNYLSGVRGFGQLFLAGYIQFFMVDMGDFSVGIFFSEKKWGKSFTFPEQREVNFTAGKTGF